PTTLLDKPQACRAVVQEPRQDDPDDAGAVRASRAAEQWIDRGPVTVLAWPARHAHIAVLDEHVMVGGRDVDLPPLDGLAVEGDRRRNRAGTGEDRGQDARARGQHVQDDEYGGRQL